MDSNIKLKIQKKEKKKKIVEASEKFLQDKRRYLEELSKESDPEWRDKSRAGKVDKQILPFVETVNKKNHLFTTSSCAGRIIVTQSNPKNKSYSIDWLFVTHDYVDCAEMVKKVKEELKEENGQEGNCRDLLPFSFY